MMTEKHKKIKIPIINIWARVFRKVRKTASRKSFEFAMIAAIAMHLLLLLLIACVFAGGKHRSLMSTVR